MVVLVIAAILMYRALRNWWGNAYRRAALRELRAATTVAQVSGIIKRTALVAFPRADVASLTGLPWSEWLAQTMREQVPTHISESLTRGVFANVKEASVVDVVAFAAKWIRRHKPPTSNW